MRNISLGKRLARLKRRLVKTITGKPDPVSEVQAFWSYVLTKGTYRQFPASYFLEAALSLRRTKDLTTAAQMCDYGVSIYPLDLSLAIEHAVIAEDDAVRMVRWHHVIELGGDRTPANAFSNLANCYSHANDPVNQEAILEKGLALHPADFSLLRKLANLLSTRGFAAKAIDAWSCAIAAHPKKDLSTIYLRLGKNLLEEGLLARAETILREGATKYPTDVPLLDAVGNLAYLLMLPSCALPTRDPAPPSTAHLFRDHFEPHACGTLAFSFGSTALRKHVPVLLDFEETVPAPKVAGGPGAVDVFAVWGAPCAAHRPVRETAAAAGKPLLCLDSGFLSFSGIDDKNAPACSVIVTPDAVYYDATCHSEVIRLLNSDPFNLTHEQSTRAETCITAIVTNHLSKFNHAPRIDLHSRFPVDGVRRILLIDQCKDSSSLHWSLGGPATFERMMETALERIDCQILVKIHPQAIAGRSPSFLAALMPSPLPENIIVIDFDINPHDLLELVDEVFVGTSPMGFEAVLVGKEVHCFAAPYYSGWGFTHDELAIPRRHRRRNATEIFHLYHITHSRYFVPEQGVAEIEDRINYLTTVSAILPPPTPNEEIFSGPLKILIVLPSGRYGASGRYVQNLSSALVRLGCQILILAEGACPHLEDGVHWLRMNFEGSRMAPQLRSKIVAFAPDFIYVNGFRSRTHRVALESVALTGARLAMQSEDDDIQVHRHRRNKQAADQLGSLDRPILTTTEIAAFLKNYDWIHSLNVLLDPAHDRWVEPLMRILCYRMACVHTAIWHPYAERLAREYAVPTLVVPPVASPADFERIPMTAQERAATLGRYHIDPAATVIFIGGALYSYSDEFATFLSALKLAAMAPAANFALVVTSGRSSLPLGPMAAEILGSSATFTDIGDAADAVYMEMLKACDVVCSPGLPDDFNRYRLPSRLVKAMAMAKPILTCRCGFGESLEHGTNAFLMDGANPESWAVAISMTHNASLRTSIGELGRKFAAENFASLGVAGELKAFFQTALAAPPHRLADFISISPEDHSSKTGHHRRNLHASSMSFALHGLEKFTHSIDTVVHLGSGNLAELNDYCRLGARRIHLIASSPEISNELRDFAGGNGIITVDETCESFSRQLPSPSDRDLLVIETDLHEWPAGIESRFRWIAVRADRDSRYASHLAGLGYREVPLPVNYASVTFALLFERHSAAAS
jgi:glycosyltransferase involved in cell wall biosynthesis